MGYIGAHRAARGPLLAGSGFLGAGLLIVGLWAGGLMIVLSGSIPGAGAGGGSTQAEGGSPFLSYRDDSPALPRMPGPRWAEPGSTRTVPSIDAQPIAVTSVGLPDSGQVPPPYFTPSVPNLPPPPDYPAYPGAPTTTPPPTSPGQERLGAFPQPTVTAPSMVPVPSVTLSSPPTSTTSAPTQPTTHPTTPPATTSTTPPRETTTTGPATGTHEPDPTTNDPEPTADDPDPTTTQATVDPGSDPQGDPNSDPATGSTSGADSDSTPAGGSEGGN